MPAPTSFGSGSGPRSTGTSKSTAASRYTTSPPPSCAPSDLILYDAFGFFSKLTGHIYDLPVRYQLFADLDDVPVPEMGPHSKSGSVKRTTVAQAFPDVGSKMLFLFDYGDHWEFRVEHVIGFA